MRHLASLLLLATVGCSSTQASSTSASTATGASTTTDSASSSSSGGGAPTIGGDRPVKLIVPESYDGKSAVPLVILLHGYGASGFFQEAYFKLTAQAEERGFLYAIPEGTSDAAKNKFWNAGDSCCNFGKIDIDDSAYLAKVIDEISAAYKVDPKRVFFIGHSNGGFMSHRMACEHADKVAAIVSVAGAMLEDLTKCKPSEPVSMLQIHGDADETVLYDGGDFSGAKYPSARTTVLDWASLNMCSTTVDGSSPPLDLENKLSGAETVVERYPKCTSPTAVELWTIKGGSHIPNFGPEFAKRSIDFLLTHPKP